MKTSFDINKTYFVRLSLDIIQLKFLMIIKFLGLDQRLLEWNVKNMKKVRILNYDNEEEIHKVGCSTHPHNTYLVV